MKVSKRRFYLTSRYFRKNLHFQKCVTVRIGFGEGFEMKILPNIKIFHKNLYFQKRRAILEYELLTVGQDISQGRQQSANPKQSAKCNRRSSKYSLVFFFCSSSPYSVASQPNAHMECTAKATEQQYIGEWNAL